MYLYVGAQSAGVKRSERGALIKKRVGVRSADAKKGESLERKKIVERGATMSKRVGARSGDVKKGRIAERFLPPDGPQRQPRWPITKRRNEEASLINTVEDEDDMTTSLVTSPRNSKPNQKKNERNPTII